MAAVSQNNLTEIVSPQEPNIDIVAIPGLQYSVSNVSTEDTWAVDGKLWLRDWLPRRLPRARVLWFTYNAEISFRESGTRLDEQARDLLGWLRSKRRRSPDRKIIFVCHSLGGLIVKQALVLAQSREAFSEIQNATFLDALGTVNDGKRRTLLKTIIDTISRSPQAPIIRDAARVEDFGRLSQEILQNSEIINFVESRKMPTLQGIIVDEKTATLGIDNERNLRLDADHAHLTKFESSDDENYQILEACICELASRAVASSGTNVYLMDSGIQAETPKAYFMVPHRRNANFVGRERHLNDLESIFWSNGEFQGRTAALVGIGGVGKTQIALKYSYRVRNRHRDVSVFWINAETTERYLESLTNMLILCNVAEAQDPYTDKISLARDWLGDPKHGNWLLVIDNADNVKNMQVDMGISPGSSKSHPSGQYTDGGLLAFKTARCSHGSILLTTRNMNLAAEFAKHESPPTMIRVDLMSREEAINLLQMYIPENIDPATCDNLPDLLGCEPLAIVQAGSYIRETSCTIHDYEEAFFKRYEESFKNDEEPRSILSVIKLCLEKIENQDAFDILSLGAFLDGDNIPEVLLRKQVDEEERFCTAISLLRKLSLVRDGRQGNFEQHRLVQVCTRRWLEARKETETWASRALDTVNEMFPTADVDNLKSCSEYLPHAQRVLQHAEEWVPHALRWTESETIEHKLLKTREKELGPNHPETLESMFRLASAHHNQGSWKEAEGLYEQLLARLSQDSAGNGEGEATRRLLVMSNLALLKEKQVRLEEASVLSRSVLRSSEMILGSDDPCTLLFGIRLASVLQSQGHLEEAAGVGESVLARLHEKPESDYPVNSSRAILASIYKDMGRFEEAEVLIAEALAAITKLKGSEHPDTLSGMSTLANIYSIQGRLVEAEQLQRQVLEATERVLGQEHPHTLNSIDDLAVTLRRLESFEEAEQLQIKVLQLKKRLLGEEHPDTLSSLSVLETTYFRMGRLSDALELNLQALKVRKAVLGGEHPDTLKSLANLAVILQSNGDLGQAEEVLREVLLQQKTVLGEKHSHTRETIAHLASLLRSQERLQEAEDLELLIRHNPTSASTSEVLAKTTADEDTSPAEVK